MSVSDGYEKTLDRILTVHQELNPLPHVKKHKIYKGDASQTVLDFLDENQHAIIALAIFDMDIYRPTKDALEAIIPRLTKGSILVFDELNYEGYPGETLALQEVLGLNNLRLNRSPYMPRCAWTRFGD